MIDPPIGLLLELSHRCPLRCGYCSNPIELVARGEELDTKSWQRVIAQAAELGVLQLHFSGGEPTLRDDLEALIRDARERELYCNLITSGVLLSRERVAALDAAGLEHVQLSFQDTLPESADHFGGFRGGHEKKLEVARWIRERGIPLTLNAVIHRQNIARAEAFIRMALELEAARIEIANVQYYGWAKQNFAALLPTRESLDDLERTIDAAREAHLGRLVIDYVASDYYSDRPKPCMDGWGRRFMNVSPAGFVLPCHAADSIPGMQFENVRERSLSEIWHSSSSFERFRGTAWMPEPCASCEFREQDFGGCRCQALALTGDAGATDPVCSRSPLRSRVDERIAEAQRASEGDQAEAQYRYRGHPRPE
jgi:pyrroloquinoline quinone biosynthesis protein E